MLRLKCLLAIVVFLLVLASPILAEADNTQMIDVVYLNNGGIIKGTIVEIVPDEIVKIQTFDGGIVTYDMAQIKKMAKEPMRFSRVVSRKEPLLGFVASMLIPGLGQVYGGDTSKGIKFFAAETATSILMTITASKISETIYYSTEPSGPFPPTYREPYYRRAAPAEYSGYFVEETNKKMLALTISLAVVLAGTHVYDLIDSYKTVKKWNEAHGFAALNVESDNRNIAIVIRKRF